jgi:Relaxase/Mobilisation nuclease domain/Large polyvalent protein-associated domain 7
MIIRHIPMKAVRRSSFSGLVQYISDPQNKNERVGKINIKNCYSTETSWAIEEVLATQAKNNRAKADKTYHLLISFAPGETLSNKILETIEEKVISSIGFKEHQRISVIHHDTDNLHIHIAINKIHPTTLNMIEPYRAYKTFANVASKLEIEFGLTITNHQVHKKYSENLADNMEKHSGIESLLNWIKRNCKERLELAENWHDMHHILSEHGLSIQLKGNGFVFQHSSGLMVKASSVSRNFSKKNLVAKLGEFQTDPFNKNIPSQNTYAYEPLHKSISKSKLYPRYIEEQINHKKNLSDKLKILKEAKKIAIEKAKRNAKIKRTALKLMKISRNQKKYLYQHISNTLIKEIKQIQKNHSKERQHYLETYQHLTWLDWLKDKAQKGDINALNALRIQNRKNTGKYSLSGINHSFLDDFKHIDSITKEGTTIYKIDQTVIRNHGHEIKITKGSSINALKKALEMAQQQYGNCIRVNGTPLFKKIILHLVVQNNMPITFADSEMQEELIKLKQETKHEYSRRNQFNGRRADSSNEALGKTGGKNKSTRTQSYPFISSNGSPSQNQNSLRSLSKFNMVQLPRGSQMLLSNNAHAKLEQQRVKSNHHV